MAHEGVGATGSIVEVADYRLYVSNLCLIGADGGEAKVALAQDGVWQLGDVALLEFEDGSDSCVSGKPPVNAAV